jgi:hypothetical protein
LGIPSVPESVFESEFLSVSESHLVATPSAQVLAARVLDWQLLGIPSVSESVSELGAESVPESHLLATTLAQMLVARPLD